MLHEHIKKIIEWTKLKVRLQVAADRDLYFREREVWWASIGANVGTEQNGKNDQFERPVLILKKFGRQTLCVLPLSSKLKSGSYYSSFSVERVLQTALLSQIRTISSKRLSRKVGQCEVDDFLSVRTAFIKMLEN